jgi:hypothetical protein
MLRARVLPSIPDIDPRSEDLEAKRPSIRCDENQGTDLRT